MNDLRKLIALNARWYEFLEEQDDSALDDIISGTSRLAALRDDGSQAGPEPRRDARSSPPAAPPSRGPLQAAQDLPKLSSATERRDYLHAAGFSVPGLRKVAKLCGLTRYSKLTRTALLDLLADFGPDRVDEPVAHRDTPDSGQLDDPGAAGTSTEQKARPANLVPPSGIARTNADAVAVAARLRETDTEEEGSSYLDSLDLDREALLAVAAQLQLTRVERLSRAELKRRVLNQAIGARRKFAGLRKW